MAPRRPVCSSPSALFLLNQALHTGAPQKTSMSSPLLHGAGHMAKYSHHSDRMGQAHISLPSAPPSALPSKCLSSARTGDSLLVTSMRDFQITRAELMIRPVGTQTGR